MSMSVGDVMVSIGLDLGKLKTSLVGALEQVKLSGEQMKETLTKALDIKNIKVKITPEWDKLIGQPPGVGDASGKGGKSGGQGKGKNEGWTSMGGSNDLMYAGMTMGGAALPLDAGIKAAIATYTQFDQAIANVNSMLGESPKQVEKMKQQVLELAKTVPGGPVALANALYGIVGAGVPAKDAMTFLGTAAKAATAGQTDTTTATMALISVMNSYGLKATDVGKISDEMFAANAAGAMTFNQFASAIGTVAGPAAQAGVSFKEVAGATAALTNEGMSAQRATMGLRALLVGIMAPTAGASKEAKKLGIEWDANALKSKGMSGMLREAIQATHGNGEELKKLIPNIAAWTAAVDLGGKGAGAYKTAMDTMNQSSGATNRALQAQEAGTGEQLNKMKAAIQSAQIAFVTGFAPALTSVANLVSKLANWFSNLSPTTQKLIGYIGLGAAAFLTFGSATFMALSAVGQIRGGLQTLGIIGKIGEDGVKSAGLLTKAFTSMGSGIMSVARTVGAALMANPMLLVWGLIIAAIVILVVEVVKHWTQIKDFLVSLWNGIVSVATAVWNGIANFFTSIWNGIVSVATSIWNGIKDFFGKWGKDILIVITGPIGMLVMLFIGHWSQIRDFLLSVWNGIKKVATAVWDAITKFFTNWIKINVMAFQLAWNILKKFFTDVWNGIVKVATAIWNGLTKFFSDMWNAQIKMFTYIWTLIKTTITNLARDAVNGVTGWFKGLYDFFANLAKDAIHWGENVVNMIAQGIKNAVHKVVDAVKSVAKGIASFLGFHSPTEDGPASDSDTWAPNLMRMMGQGISDNMHLVQDPLNEVFATNPVTHYQTGRNSNYRQTKKNSDAQHTRHHTATTGSHHGHTTGSHHAKTHKHKTGTHKTKTGHGETIQIIFQGPVYGMDDFENKIDAIIQKDAPGILANVLRQPVRSMGTT